LSTPHLEDFPNLLTTPAGMQDSEFRPWANRTGRVQISRMPGDLATWFGDLMDHEFMATDVMESSLGETGL